MLDISNLYRKPRSQNMIRTDMTRIKDDIKKCDCLVMFLLIVLSEKFNKWWKEGKS